MSTASLPRLSCGSLRSHGPHDWIGQTTVEVFTCPGAGRSALSAEDRAACAEEAAWKRRLDR